MKVFNTLIKYLSLGLFFQSSFGQQIQYSFPFKKVAMPIDNFTPRWTVTSNPEHSYSLGTYQSIDLLNDPFYFTTYLFNASSPVGGIASHQMIADGNCTIKGGRLKVLFPTLTNAYYFYVLSGKFCADNGLLKITNFDVSGDQIKEINTLTASGFIADEQSNDGPTWEQPPPSNYGRSDVILPFYTTGSDFFSVARASVKLQDNNMPLEINITRAVYDFRLQQFNRSYDFFDLSALPKNSLIQWQYTAPYLVVGILSVDSKTIFLNLYSPNSETIHTSVDLPEFYNGGLYDFSLHPVNASAFLLYNRILNPDETSALPYIFRLHVISIDGKLEFLGSKATSGISALLVLQQNHGPFLRGGVLCIENTVNVARPNLIYFDKHQQRSFLLPDSPWWLLSGEGDTPKLAEGAEALHLNEMQKLPTLGYELGCYNLPWAPPKTT
ncbi:MAG: hypothetical protein EPN84_04165, partial [Legionella sp.]